MMLQQRGWYQIRHTESRVLMKGHVLATKTREAACEERYPTLFDATIGLREAFERLETLGFTTSMNKRSAVAHRTDIERLVSQFKNADSVRFGRLLMAMNIADVHVPFDMIRRQYYVVYHEDR